MKQDKEKDLEMEQGLKEAALIFGRQGIQGLARWVSSSVFDGAGGGPDETFKRIQLSLLTLDIEPDQVRLFHGLVMRDVNQVASPIPEAVQAMFQKLAHIYTVTLIKQAVEEGTKLAQAMDVSPMEVNVGVLGKSSTDQSTIH